MKTKRKFFYVIHESQGYAKQLADFKVYPDNYISISGFDPVPMEDYNYVYTDREMTERQAFDYWMEHI